MLNKLKKSNNQGFTIIEVMIVLAIAALILLIVLLAVPALQRSARNTQRKNDISAVAAAISNFIANNGGALPTQAGYSNADPTTLILGCSGTTPTLGSGTWVSLASDTTYTGSCTSTNTNSETAKMGLYALNGSKSPVYITSGTSFTANTNLANASASVVTPDSFIINLGYGCNSTNSGPDTTANPRTASILYSTETGGTASVECVEQ